jgi:hypothetical protein
LGKAGGPGRDWRTQLDDVQTALCKPRSLTDIGVT